MNPVIGSVIAGKYEVKRLLGQGGMGAGGVSGMWAFVPRFCAPQMRVVQREQAARFPTCVRSASSRSCRRLEKSSPIMQRSRVFAVFYEGMAQGLTWRGSGHLGTQEVAARRTARAAERMIGR